MKFASCVCQCLTTLLGDFMIRFQFWITFGMIQWSNDPPWSSLISICCGGFEPAPRTGSLAHPSLRHDAVGVRRLLQGPAEAPGTHRTPAGDTWWNHALRQDLRGLYMIMIHDVLYTSGWITMRSLEWCWVREIIPKCPDFSYFQMS